MQEVARRLHALLPGGEGPAGARRPVPHVHPLVPSAVVVPCGAPDHTIAYDTEGDDAPAAAAAVVHAPRLHPGNQAVDAFVGKARRLACGAGQGCVPNSLRPGLGSTTRHSKQAGKAWAGGRGAGWLPAWRLPYRCGAPVLVLLLGRWALHAAHCVGLSPLTCLVPLATCLVYLLRAATLLNARGLSSLLRVSQAAPCAHRPTRQRAAKAAALPYVASTHPPPSPATRAPLPLLPPSPLPPSPTPALCIAGPSMKHVVVNRFAAEAVLKVGQTAHHRVRAKPSRHYEL